MNISFEVQKFNLLDKWTVNSLDSEQYQLKFSK